MTSIIIAILALLFSIFTYVTHDRKLKEQEKQLNEYRLRAFAKDEEENKKAVIRAKAVKSGGRCTVFICNMGNAKAKNLTVAMDNEEQVSATRPDLPVTYHELLPDASREILLLLTEGDDELTLNYTWDDDFGTNNKENQTIDL